MRRGFSLVELLVVVAVISVLAALLLPTLEQGLESARQTACANSLRQINLVFSSYCNSNCDWLPRYNTQRWTGDWVSNRQWFWNMRAELADEINPNGAVSLKTDSTPTVKPASFLLCPSSRKMLGMNPYGIGGFVWIGLGKPTPYQKLPQVKKPSRQIGFGDAGSPTASGVGGHFPSGSIDYPHLDTTTSLFVDGHILCHDKESVKYMNVKEVYPTISLANVEAWGWLNNVWWGYYPWGNP